MQKVKKLAVPTPEYIEGFIKKREVSSAKSPNKLLSPTKEKDYEYLSNVFESLVMVYADMNVPKKLKRVPKFLKRYAPKQMFDNSIVYIRKTIEARQPLTITGLGLFLGMRRTAFFKILHDQKLVESPFMRFMYDFADFVEMYNEYAAHQKQNPAGPIFILKNFGWSDRYEIEASATQGALTPEEREQARKRIFESSELIEGKKI